MPPFNARNVAKYVAKFVVAAKTAQAAETLITDHTSLEEDTIIVDLASKMTGWYVSDKLEPYTNAAVDKAADKIADYRAKKQEKKNTEETK